LGVGEPGDEAAFAGARGCGAVFGVTGWGRLGVDFWSTATKVASPKVEAPGLGCTGTLCRSDREAA
jgi:hypothetical protein